MKECVKTIRRTAGIAMLTGILLLIGSAAGELSTNLQVRKEIAEKSGITTRSLYRYEAAYRADGFAGLKPMNREQRRTAGRTRRKRNTSTSRESR